MNIYEQLKRRQKVPVRLVGLDLDGTVFTEAKEITPRTIRAISRAIEQGITVLPATGRPEIGIPEAFLKIPGVRYCLCSNGAEIIDRKEKKSIYQNCLSSEKVLEIIPWFLKQECTCELYMYNGIYGEYRQRELWEKVIPDPGILDYVRATRTLVEDLMGFYQSDPLPVDKINTSFGDDGLKHEAYERLLQVSGIAISSGTPANLEVNKEDCDKGEAMLALGQLLGIPKESIMACGDSSNDLAMIEKVGCGAAMGNALPVILNAADVTTLCNEEEGVAELLEAVMRLNAEFVQ